MRGSVSRDGVVTIIWGGGVTDLDLEYFPAGHALAVLLGEVADRGQ